MRLAVRVPVLSHHIRHIAVVVALKQVPWFYTPRRVTSMANKQTVRDTSEVILISLAMGQPVNPVTYKHAVTRLVRVPIEQQTRNRQVNVRRIV